MIWLALIDTVLEAGLVAAALTAILTLLILAAKKMNQLGQWLHNINRVVTNELTHNHGTSMKDQLQRVEEWQEKHDSQYETLQETLDEHLQDVKLHTADPEAHHRPDCPDDGHAGPRR